MRGRADPLARRLPRAPSAFENEVSLVGGGEASIGQADGAPIAALTTYLKEFSLDESRNRFSLTNARHVDGITLATRMRALVCGGHALGWI